MRLNGAEKWDKQITLDLQYKKPKWSEEEVLTFLFSRFEGKGISLLCCLDNFHLEWFQINSLHFFLDY